VADAYNDRIQVFGPEGTFRRKWGGPFALNIPGSLNGWFNVATAVAADHEGNFYVADFYNHRVQKFSGKGKFLVSIGEKGSGPGELRLPTDVAVDEVGNLYVVDFGHDRIVKFTPGD
jgi:DNA-binding beta-propeller fold protein YncE